MWAWWKEEGVENIWLFVCSWSKNYTTQTSNVQFLGVQCLFVMVSMGEKGDGLNVLCTSAHYDVWHYLQHYQKKWLSYDYRHPFTFCYSLLTPCITRRLLEFSIYERECKSSIWIHVRYGIAFCMWAWKILWQSDTISPVKLMYVTARGCQWNRKDDSLIFAWIHTMFILQVEFPCAIIIRCILILDQSISFLKTNC